MVDGSIDQKLYFFEQGVDDLAANGMAGAVGYPGDGDGPGEIVFSLSEFVEIARNFTELRQCQRCVHVVFRI